MKLQLTLLLAMILFAPALLTKAADQTIYDIQGQTAESPFIGQADITTWGIVTATSSDGYWIQDTIGKAWNGLYVYDNTNTPEIGDSIKLTGTIDEYFELTEMKDVTSFNVISSGHTITPVSIQTGDMGEAYEGVFIKVSSANCSNADADYGMFEINDGSGTLLVDDDIYAFSATQGTSYDITGVGHYSWEAYKILPRMCEDIDYTGKEPCNTHYKIIDIQGETAESPYKGSAVTTSGIVTTLDGTDGYWIQDSVGAWSGIYVYDNTNTPSVGDSIVLSGSVDEFYNVTQLKSISSYEVVSSGNSIAPVTISSGSMGEAWESVLIKVTNAECTNADAGFGMFEVNDGSGALLADDDLYAFTASAGTNYDITGLGHFSFSEHKILPRSANDIDVTTNSNLMSSANNVIIPNPVDNGTIEVITGSVVKQIQLINISGMQINSVSNSPIMDVNKLPEGIYFIRITLNNGTVLTNQIMIQ